MRGQLTAAAHCPDGGIGRHKGLKIPRRKLCRFESGSGHHDQQQQGAAVRQPNPMDPLDGFKRWMEDLWPVQRWAVYIMILAVAVVLVLWAIR